MATKFGASSVGNSNTKVFWIIGCLLTLFAVVLITFAVISQNNSQPVEAVQNQPVVEPSVELSANKDDIVVPVARIEEGTKLDQSMFTTVSYDNDKIPLGALRKKDVGQITGKFANKLLFPNVPLNYEDMAQTKGLNPLSIPAGYRAVTITVDSRSGVEGFAKPNSRVDVLWTFTQDGSQKVSTIVRFTKVLSVGGITSTDENGKAQVGNEATTVTLLVSEKDAKKIELARNLGTLSLSLVGDQEEGTKEEDPDVIDINTLLNAENKPVPTKAEEPADGYMQTKDPKTGKIVRYAYHKSTRKWTVDRSQDDTTNNLQPGIQ